MANLILFEQNQIRSVWNKADQKRYFVVEHVIAALTDSSDPKQYVKRMKQCDREFTKGWVQIVPLPFDMLEWKMRPSQNMAA